ncbi:MAG: hypothetical protein LQ349_007893, partial [Xanthoria aureola]
MASGHLSIEDVSPLNASPMQFTTPARNINNKRQFFTRLSSLFQARRNSTHGSIYLTQKR